MLRNRFATACLLCTSLVVLACGEEQTFEDILPTEEVVADFERIRVRGGEKLILEVIEVRPEMIHPEFIGRWTDLRREIEVDFYVLPEADFDPLKDPKDLDNVLWTSVADDGVGFGDRQVTEMHLHPPEGRTTRWVMFFYNPNPAGPTTEAELSAEIRLVWFQ